jgi:hypothetical protein
MRPDRRAACVDRSGVFVLAGYSIVIAHANCHLINKRPEALCHYRTPGRTTERDNFSRRAGVNISSTLARAKWPRWSDTDITHGQSFNLGAVGNHRGRRCPLSGVRVACGLPHRLVALLPAVAAPGGSVWVAGSAGRCSSAGVTRAALVPVTFAEAIGAHRAGARRVLTFCRWLIARIGGRRIGTRIGTGPRRTSRNRRTCRPKQAR